MNNNSCPISAIENNCIAANTKKRYSSTNFAFILWLHEKYPDLLRPSLRDEIASVVSTDHKVRMRSLRKIIIENWLEKMQRTNPERCPIDMSRMTYEIVGSYMSTKRDANGRLLSKNAYSGIRSSVVYLFTMSNTNVPSDFNSRMGTLLKGFKRTIVEQRVAAGESLEEGKEAMSFECYKLLCKKFFQGEKDEYHFAHLFLLLEWNLIAQSDNIVGLHVNDFEFLGDALLVYMKKKQKLIKKVITVECRTTVTSILLNQH